jgi:hypothetical protein
MVLKPTANDSQMGLAKISIYVGHYRHIITSKDIKVLWNLNIVVMIT